MQVVYAGEYAPECYSKSIFLAGPTPRSAAVPSWRPRALELLAQAGYDGVVFSPEPRGGAWRSDYLGQIEWEERHLNMADCILFWIPRELETMPGFTTNVEWGVWQDSGKVVLGVPEGAAKVRYQLYYAKKLQVPVCTELAGTVASALSMVGDGAQRSGGEREVPLGIWRTPHFQCWYGAQRQAGNRLEGARVVWTFRVGPGRSIDFFWALHVNIYVAREDRRKCNEVVISRPDIAAVVLYRRGASLEETQIVSVREFRSPSASADGYVLELPSGSSFKGVADPLELAVAECAEETGFSLDPRRLVSYGARQLAATMSAHRAHVFGVELELSEIEELRARQGVVQGVGTDSERTFVEVVSLGEILRQRRMDWSTLGMIMSVLTGGATDCAGEGGCA